MIAVDVNTIAYLWIPGEKTALAEAALSRDPMWASPILWRSEFRNVLAGFLRRGTLDMDGAIRCSEGAESQMARGEHLVPSRTILRCVAASRCSAYDCEYVALAVELRVPLVTSDRQILRAFPSVAVDLRDFAVSH